MTYPARRLGFAVKIAGRPDLEDHDSRRWQNGPYLRVSLEYLDRIFDYLPEHRIRMYRMSSHLAPYITPPDLDGLEDPRFDVMLEAKQNQLALLRLAMNLPVEGEQILPRNLFFIRVKSQSNGRSLQFSAI